MPNDFATAASYWKANCDRGAIAHVGQVSWEACLQYLASTLCFRQIYYVVRPQCTRQRAIFSCDGYCLSISTSIVNFTSSPTTALNLDPPTLKSLRRIKHVAENPLIVLPSIVCGSDGPSRSRVTDLVTPLSVKFPSS